MKRFDDFLAHSSTNLEKILGFESCIILLINHKMKAFFVNQFKDYEREDFGKGIIEENKQSAQEKVTAQKRNLSKLLLGVGLTSK
jgi:hypothetical protein